MLDDAVERLSGDFEVEEKIIDCKAGNSYQVPNELVEGGRNDGLFRYASSLQAQGYSDEEVRSLVQKANVDWCHPALPDSEVNKISDSALTRYEKGETKKFDHAVFADVLIMDSHMCFIDGAPAIWNKDRYVAGDEAIQAEMIKRRHSITARQRTEVMKYLQLIAPKYEMSDERFIAFENGVLDITTGELQENTPGLHILNVIPHDWNPEASSKKFDAALDGWTCGHADIRLSILETFGLCLYRGRRFDSCPVFTGGGSNGKSTCLNFLHGMLGETNVSSLDIAIIGERFQSTVLVGKLANIGDDIANEYVSGAKASVVKRVISGDWTSAEYKGGATISFKPYCTMVFSCNEMPSFGDRSDGMYRRFVPIPFKARFTAGTKGCDLGLGEELRDETTYQYAIVLAVHALKDCIKRGGVSRNENQEALLEEMKLQNSNVYQFCTDLLHFGQDDAVSVVGQQTTAHYQAYKTYCEDTGTRAMGQNKFTTEMNRIYKTKSVKSYLDFSDGRRQVRVFESVM